MELIDFQSAAQNIFARDYGGASGQKKEMRYGGSLWMIKYPSNLRALREIRKGKIVPSYSMSSVSEWLGSHVYGTLGIPVHETLLGRLDGKIVVACKHIQKSNEQILEFRGLLKSWVDEERYDEMKRNPELQERRSADGS